MSRAILLDRDGVLNVQVLGKYVNKPEDLVPFDYVPRAISIFNSLGFECYIISNQSGVALGHLSLGTLAEINGKLMREVRDNGGGKIKRVYSCTHSKDPVTCKCRKPQPGLILQCASENNLDLKKCFMVGDQASDIEAGHRAGCPTVAVLSGFLDLETVKEIIPQPRYIMPDLIYFAEYLQRMAAGLEI